MSTEGKKYDAGKVRYDLIPWEYNSDADPILRAYAQKDWQLILEISKLMLRQFVVPNESIARILTRGASLYGDDNWRLVESHRYRAALMRHYMEHLSGNLRDADTDEPHLAHVCCNALFLLELDVPF